MASARCFTLVSTRTAPIVISPLMRCCSRQKHRLVLQWDHILHRTSSFRRVIASCLIANTSSSDSSTRTCLCLLVSILLKPSTMGEASHARPSGGRVCFPQRGPIPGRYFESKGSPVFSSRISDVISLWSHAPAATRFQVATARGRIS